MAKNKNISFCVMAFVLSIVACGPLQQSTVTPVPPDTSTVAPVPAVASPITPPLEPTSTFTSTPLPIPTTTATQPPEDIAPFRFVTSLAGLPVDSNEEVQVRALADGSVWIITSQVAMRWDGQVWQVGLVEGEGGLAGGGGRGQRG